MYKIQADVKSTFSYSFEKVRYPFPMAVSCLALKTFLNRVKVILKYL